MLNEAVDPARRTKIMLKQSALKQCITLRRYFTYI